jgi:PAS domain S-box-containing protein
MAARTQGANPTREQLDLRTVIDTIPALVVCALPDGSVEFVNQSWRAYTGRSLEQLTGWGWQSVIHTDDLSKFMDEWTVARAAGKPFETEARVRRSDGQFRWFLISKVPLRDQTDQIVRWYGTGYDIEDRKQAEGRTQESDRELRTIIETIPAFVGTALPDGSVDFISQSWLDYTGLTREEWLDWGWKTATHPEDLDRSLAKWRAALAAGEPIEQEARYRQADGSYRWFLGRNVPLRDEEGNIVKWYGTLHDIEDHKRAEDSLKRSEAYLVHAQQLTKAGSWAYKPPDICEYWSEEMFRMYGFDPSKGYPPSAEVMSLTHPADRQRVEEALAEHFKHGRVFDLKFRIIRPDGQLRVIRDFGTPILENGVVTRFVGACLDVTEEEQRIEELRRNEFLLAQAQRLTRVGSWVTKFPDIPEHWSPVSFEIFGMDPAQGPPRNTAEFISHVHPEDREGLLQATEAFVVQAGSVYDVKYRIVRPNGEIRVVREVGTPVYENAVPTHFMGAWMDITEQEQRTDELRRSELYLSEGQRLAHMGSWAFNPSGFFDYWSSELFQIYGLHPAKGAPTLEGYLALLHPEDRASMARTIEEMLAGHLGCDVKKRIVRPDGEIRYIRYVGVPVFDQEVFKHVLGTAIDVTEQELLTQELQRRQAYLAKAQRLSHTGSFGWNVRSGEIYWSDETFRIFECDRAARPTLELVRQRAHPDDREVMQQTLDHATSEGTDFDIEHRLLMPDGRVKHLHVLSHASRDSSGNLEFVGAVMDITATRQAEEALRKSESLLAHAQQLTKVGSWSYKPPDVCEFWSAEMFRIFGFDPANGLPANDEIFPRVHPEDRERVNDAVAEHFFRRGAVFDLKYRLIMPDGQLRVVRDFGMPVLENEVVTRFVGACLDVTEQENLTQELRRREAYLAEAQKLSHTGSFGWNVQGSEMSWSDETFRIFEYDRQAKPTLELVLERVHPDDRPLVQQTMYRASREGTGFDTEYRLLMSDGRVKHLHVLADLLHDSSGNLELTGAVTDITATREAAEALRKSEQQWRDVFENNPTMYFMVNAAGAVMAVNPFGAEQLGYSVDELIGQPVLKVFYQLDREAAQSRVAKCLKQLGQSMSWELRKVRKDGSMLWVRETARAVLRDGEPVVLIACEDVTERHAAEEKIREQEIELRQMLDLAPQLIFVQGPSGDRLHANQAVLDYYGQTLEQFLSSDRRDFFYPGDLERITSEVQGKLSSGISHEAEGRLLRKDGTYRWFLLRRNPLRDQQGRVMRWYLSGTDIDDRKRAEERLRHENVALREEIDKASMFEEIVGTSPALQTVLSRLSKVAPTDSTVLITGETGTGKELVARAIHRRSHRSSRAFVSVNCAAIPRDLIASELFGHEKGAFTGATQRRLGRFELAEGGTIFLDEIGELPAETQIALLRVLQEHEFERVGGTRSIQTDVRVIAATNRDVQAAIAAGAFRSDLFYRLNVFPIEIPSLCERREDIPLLVEYFIDRYARKAGKNMLRVNTKTLDLLQSYPWPGNIRELQNVIERSVIVCETEDFSIDESWLSRQPAVTEPEGPVEFSEKLAAQEKEIIEAALRSSGGRVFGPSGAAASLGMPRSTLESKIRSLKINKNRFKS